MTATTTDLTTTDPIVPDFSGEDCPLPEDAADPSTPPGRKLVIICSKGNLDMAYPGLILANAALGEATRPRLNHARHEARLTLPRQARGRRANP